ncbi:adenosylcobinamide amidohydrolase [Streptomyces sp. NRRL F-5727]|uniref:adenosylcobinamide amidohydrolase n=1 Tax=Streptomyces sp. NRRL F-5727 TaxID=1463871 RepID=UPI0004C865A1|nr:adenosylcobinamide amidohydrolase [Streptomyces sp. NRRL F-5727]
MTAVVEPGLPVLPDAPELWERDEDGQLLGALVWRHGPGWRAVSSAVLGGGIGERSWVMNVQVAHGYTRTDPEAHLAGLARRAGLHGPGVGLMTAARVAARGAARDGGVDAVATAGIEVRGWAAAPGPAVPGPQAPGTINIVVTVPAPLTDAALVNAVATATEAKTQALLEAGHDCSGTPTDAVCVLALRPAPGGPAEPFAGPRSLWGARLARAVHAAVGGALSAPGVS